MTVRVLLADDQDLVRAGFRIILGSAPGIEVVGEARDGAEAVELTVTRRPDVVVMDIEMPGTGGLEATRRILDPARDRDRAAVGAPRPAVLVLTTFGRQDYLFEALRAGASGFLLKTATPEELIEAVGVVHRGDALLAPQLTRCVVERALDRTGARPAPVPALATLTDREREVLDRLSLGLSNAEIARDLYLGEATVKTHVSNVLGKLGLRDRTAAVVFAYEHGVAVPGGDAPGA